MTMSNRGLVRRGDVMAALGKYRDACATAEAWHAYDTAISIVSHVVPDAPDDANAAERGPSRDSREGD